MSHDLDIIDGQAAFFSARVVPWHQLGTVTDRCLTAEEAILTAHLDWEVEKVSLLADTGESYTEVPEHFGTIRRLPGNIVQVLGVVGNKYEVIQNSEAFQVLNDIAGQSGAHFETAGAIQQGKRVFVSMKMPETLMLDSETEDIELYLLASTSHDGSQALTLAVTPVRVVCTNTLVMGLGTARRTFSIRHTNQARERMEQARRALGLTVRYSEQFAVQANAMLHYPYSRVEYIGLVDELNPQPHGEDITERQMRNWETTRENMIGMWSTDTQAEVVGTAWGAWNAIVEYADWYAPVKAKENKEDARAQRNLIGTNDSLKQKAYQLVLQSMV